MNTYRYAIILSFYFCICNVSAQVSGLNAIWARGSTSVLHSAGGEGYDVTIDAAGNCYLSGWPETDSAIYFGPYSIQATSTTLGVTGVSLLAKYSPSGQVQWATLLPYLWGDPANIVADNSGNVFTFGQNDDPSDVHQYLLKIDTSAACVWADSFSGASVTGIRPNAVTTDVSGNVYYGGSYYTNSFVTIGLDTLYGVNGPNYYLAKYTNTGNLQWARSSPVHFNKGQITGLAQNANGVLNILGTFSQKLLIANDTLKGMPAPNGSGAFIARYDTSGNAYWGRSILSPSSITVSDLSTDMKGNIWVYGSFTDSLFYGDSLVATGQSINNIFILKLNESGKLIWVRTSFSESLQGSLYPFTGYKIVVDSIGRTYICGGGFDSIYTNEDSIIYRPNSASANSDNSFILAYDSNGHIICFQPFPHGGDDWNALALDHSGNVFFGGDYTNGSFILGADTLPNTIQYGKENLFIAKFAPCGGSNGGGVKGINELSANNSSLLLKPNPSNGFTTISYNYTGVSSNATLMINDIIGREMSSYPLHTTQDQFNLNTNLFKAGIYLVSIVSEGQILVTSKLVVE